MGVIDDFIIRYRREFDFYNAAARLSAEAVDSRLKAEGIRAIVSSRAKDPKRTEVKCRQRESLSGYRSVDDIFEDIVDLAGVRIALYFPGDQELVENLITDVFEVMRVKEFPGKSAIHPDKKFRGYAARHYRVRLKSHTVASFDPRYGEAKIEIQVASVLMHAWAEVEHDLGYKPDDVRLSREELMILDELNGLVLAGEIALERLQAAGEERASSTGRRFTNHYDLAAHLLGKLSQVSEGPLISGGLGRVDQLFDFLSIEGVDTPELVAPYLNGLHADLDRRPLAEQVIDALLQADPSRYDTYLQLRNKYRDVDGAPAEFSVALGDFVRDWIDFEMLMQKRLGPVRSGRPRLPTSVQIKQLTANKPWMTGELQYLRQLRNEVVHGNRDISAADLRQAQETLRLIMAELEKD
jgi:ppGpp synthetase/RelA/SpoT-type nucleotidyltranferase